MVVESKVNLDEVDQLLDQEDGQIVRKPDPNLCRHNARQKCSHCLPLDPYDEEYLKSKEIKHMSFHSYIRKLTAGQKKGSHLRRPLENIKCSIDLSCSAHKPYPKGICTKCRPPMVTLNSQRFRHVDNISIENDQIANNFIDFWRKTGLQRVGYLIGKYQTLRDVPLGIKATVAAIYEPPQNSTADGVKLLDDPNEEKVSKICEYLGLRKVGWIFTDLWPADRSKGTVHCSRSKHAYSLSAQECITAGDFQNKNRNLTKYCTDGYFGSKFVTLVASGDESEHINFHGWQVSNQCSALVEAKLLCPTNYPELAYVREKPLHEQHFLTDVQYTEKNEYGAEVRKDGRPLPVEYLLVDVPAGIPKEPASTFTIPHATSFAIENRGNTTGGEIQGGANFISYIRSYDDQSFLTLATNFHFIYYLATNDLVQFTDKEIKDLCSAVAAGDADAAQLWATECVNWQQLFTVSREQHQSGHSTTTAHADAHQWSCAHCTFVNTETRPDCAVCGLPAAH